MAGLEDRYPFGFGGKMREGVAVKAIGPVIFPRRNPGAGIGTLALQRIALRFQLEAVAVAS
jgi:hypothetical protein